MEKKKRAIDFKKIASIIGLLTTLLGFIFAVIIYLSQKSQKNILIEAKIISNDEITLYAPEQQLNARFTYAGEEVKHLWKQIIRFDNKNIRTVVGKGKMMNIIGDGINFSFPDNTRLLKMQITDNAFDGVLVKLDSNKFQLQFSQWRQDEYLIGLFYVASEVELKKKPILSVIARDIIDGDVRIQDRTELKSQEGLFVVDSLPRYLAQSGKIIGVFVLIGLSVLVTAFLVHGWREFFLKYPKYKNWNDMYKSKFYEYLKKAELNLTAEWQTYYKNNIMTVPDSIWKGFEGEKYPGAPDFDKPRMAIIATFVSLVILFGSIIMLLSLIPVKVWTWPF